MIRCPECGDPVKSFFDHVDRDCEGVMPDRVAKGFLLPPLTDDERAAAYRALGVAFEARR